MSRQPVFPGWRVVAGSAVGIGFSAQIFIAAGYTIFAAALGTAFGWSISQLASGATLFLLGQVISFPIVGALLDRYGSRRVAVTGIALFGLLLLATSRVEALWQLYSLMFLMGLAGPATYTLPYMRALSLWFVRRRGLAIGIAASGIALGGALFPTGIQKIAGERGWSDAIAAVGLLELLVCLPLVAWLVRDDPRRLGLLPDGDEAPGAGEQASARAAPAEHGLSFAEAVRTVDFWIMGTIYMLGGLAVYAVITNASYILTQTGARLTAGQVAMAQSVLGISVLVGRIAGGIALDRLSTRAIAVVMTLVIAAAIFGYAVSTSLSAVVLSAFLMGLATGGEGDVLPYMAVKYFGPRAFGKIYGMLGAMFAVGTALGPVTYAALADWTASPSKPLYMLGAMTAVIAFGFLGVGRRQYLGPAGDGVVALEEKLAS